MTSFLAIDHYSPLLVLVTGIFTFVGLWGLGTGLLALVRLRFPPPWNHVAALLLGIQALSLVVQSAGIAGMASQSVLTTIWWAIVAIGVTTLGLRNNAKIATPFSKPDGLALLPIGILLAGIAINLLVALAPSTKIDELNYHMLIPSRIVSDGALHFYREPWQGAILPHMIFQISSAPAHAIGSPDAANVVSWGLSATLLWFAWHIIQGNAKPTAWTAFWVAGLCVGMYPVVWHVTGGAHAMGDLAMAAAIVAFYNRAQLLKAIPIPAYVALLSILLLSASASKVSLLPLCGFLLCFVTFPLIWSAQRRVGRQCTLALAVPWIVFFCPIALWTFSQSGSPFGPVLADLFAPSVYAQDRLQETIRYTTEVNRLPLIPTIQYFAVGYSPGIWLGVIGAIFWTDLSKPTRVILACLVGLQCSLIYWLLPYDARFLGGLHYGLLISFAAFAAGNLPARLSSTRSMATACAAILVPWLAIQAFYAKQFLPVVLGLETVDAFSQRYIAFYADFVKLDGLLPRDTVLLVQDFRLGAVYAPRKVYFDRADLPRGKRVVLFASPETIEAARVSFGDYRLGEIIYENPRAVTAAFRTPGRQVRIGPLRVGRLEPIE